MPKPSRGTPAIPHAPSTPMSPAQRARLAGLTVLARHGPTHMATIGARGQSALDRRIALEAGIPDNAPDHAVRLAAAKRVYFTRLRKRRP
jgi:hypothetical protein